MRRRSRGKKASPDISASKIDSPISIANVCGVLIKSTLFIGVVGGLWHNYNDTQQRFFNLVIHADHVTNDYEKLYNDCQNNNTMLIAQDLANLRKSTTRLVDTHKSMGKLVDEKTYCTLHVFTHYMDTLLSIDNDKVCGSALLKNVQVVDNYKYNVLEKQVNQDQASYRFSLKSPLSYLMGKQYETYAPENCAISID